MVDLRKILEGYVAQPQSQQPTESPPQPVVNRRPGAPRRKDFTGPGWDELSDEQRRAKSASVRAKEQREKKRLRSETIDLPRNMADKFKYQKWVGSYQLMEAYAKWVALSKQRQENVESFKIWLATLNTEVDAAEYEVRAIYNRLEFTHKVLNEQLLQKK